MTAEALATIGLHPGWLRIEARKIEDKNYDLALIYNEEPATLFQVKADTAEIAEAVLKGILSHGGHPADDRDFVTVAAERNGLKGITGKPLSEFFGFTMYDFNDDSLVFKPGK